MMPNLKTSLVGLSALCVLFLVSCALFQSKTPPVVKESQDFAHFSYNNVPVSPSSRRPASTQALKARSGTILYKPKINASASQKTKLSEFMGRHGLNPYRKLAQQRVLVAKTSQTDGEGNEQQLAEEMMASGAVEFAEPDRLKNLSSYPNDPFAINQWHHTRVHSFEAWGTTKGHGREVLVASCDTGVESTHPDLRRNLQLPGYNAEDGTSNSEALNPHGTMTAGTIAAFLNNKVGVAGMMENVKILPIRISNAEDGTAYISTMAACIEYAADHGAKVVNLSYEGADSFTIDAAAQYLRSKGGLLVMAAGNAGRDLWYNADFQSFVVVGATDQNDNHVSWSNFGTPIDLVAPGLDILTTGVGGTYAWASGTSFAAPVVAGVAGMLYGMNPDFTPSDVENILFSSATRLGTGMDDPNFGSGRVDALAAVTLAKEVMTAGKKPRADHHRRKKARASL